MSAEPLGGNDRVTVLDGRKNLLVLALQHGAEHIVL